jgi:hypothetical protein
VPSAKAARPRHALSPVRNSQTITSVTIYVCNRDNSQRCLLVTHMVKLQRPLALGELPQPSNPSFVLLTATRISRGFLYSTSRVCLPGHPDEQASVALQADPLQCNGERTSYDVRYDVEFVLLAAWRATGGYVTGRLKRLAELQAASLAETSFETQLATIARVWEPTNWPQIGNHTSPSWVVQASVRLVASYKCLHCPTRPIASVH